MKTLQLSASPITVAIVALPIIVTVLWKVGGSLLRDYFLRRYTVVKDLPNAGTPRQDEERIKGTAVICGGRYVHKNWLALGS